MQFLQRNRVNFSHFTSLFHISPIKGFNSQGSGLTLILQTLEEFFVGDGLVEVHQVDLEGVTPI